MCCDFDGTICFPDSCEHLLDKYGNPAWKEYDAQVWRGELSERAAWEKQIATLNCTWEEARTEIGKGIAIRNGFREFLDYCRKQQLPFIVLSSGLQQIIDELLVKFGFSGLTVYANRAEINGRQWQLVPYPVEPLSDRCSHCKCVHLLRFKAQQRRIIYIGDGMTDVCPAHHADVVFATGQLAAHRRALDLPTVPFDSFTEIVSYLRSHVEPLNSPR